ncbi:MAG TPA: SdrD B-like domain-containing protein [Chitinophagales bacterium]|nr:SdrD B-like domain-containing protein [Chitinophagales bacterium]
MIKNDYFLKKLILLSLILAFSSVSIYAQVSGTVFRDYDGDGTKDANEPLVSGIVVNAYLSDAATPCATVTTVGSSSPNYTLSGCGVAPVRVEFLIPASNNCVSSAIDYTSSSGTTYGTSVQFVNGNSSNVNFAINNPIDYNTGSLGTKIYIPTSSWGNPLGGGTSGTYSWFVGYPYTYTGNDPLGTNPPTNVVSGEVMGVTWGTAYSKHAQKIFTSALLKRHVGLGTLGSGGIYTLTPSGTTFSVTSFYDLDANGYQTRSNGTCGLSYGNGSSFTVDGTGQTITYNGSVDASGSPCGLGVVGSNDTDRQLPINIGNNPSYDPAAYDQVGKVGLGDIDISDDGRYLFVTNLYTKKILRLELNDVYNPTAVVSVHIFDLPAIGCNNGVLRPWGLKYYRGKLYVGAVCTGENGGTNNNTGSPTDLYAYVLELSNPLGSGTISSTPLVSIPLNYLKGDPFGSSQTNINQWYPWSHSTSDFITNDNNVLIGTLPQPILSDIEFDERGDIVLSMMDRAGHQYGIQNRKYLTSASTALVSDVISGDILIAGYNCGTNTYSVENNGSVVSQGTTYTGGVGNGEGIGGGEFFKGDKIPGFGHLETGMGSAAILPGYNEMAFAVMDPIRTNSAGTVRMSTINGDTIALSKYQVYQGNGITSGYFGKANGLGDIELSGSPAPLEIGNRVWTDTDEDGIQDANEAGIDGITVLLFEGSTQVGTATTANGGQWYFNDSNTTGGLKPNTAYTVRVQSSAFPSGQSLTNANADGTTNGDLRDSDASLVSGNAEIAYTTSDYGKNDHTLDMGFRTALAVGSVGNYVWFDANSDGLNNEPTTAGINGVTIELWNADTNTMLESTITANDGSNNPGYYNFIITTSGNYYIHFPTTNNNHVLTAQNPTAAIDDNSDANTITGNSATFAININGTGTDKDNPTIDGGYKCPTGCVPISASKRTN